ncbi:MAG: MFS transporter [Sulfuricellaceae bacterium]
MHFTLSFRALRHRNFRLYFSGQLVSLVGTWMQQVAMGWLVYRLTGSVFLLGVVGFSSQIPILLFAPFGGVFSDRFNRHRLLILTQALAMLQAFSLAALTLAHLVQVWHLIVMAALLGLINAVDAPARQSLVVFLVEKREDMANAIALNSLVMNATRLVGPAIAGWLVGLVGEGYCFLLNGLSYVAVLFALTKIRVHIPHQEPHPIRRGLGDGLRYTVGHGPIRGLLTLVALLSVTVVPYIVLMPYYAREVFHGDARTLGLLMACSGAGALLGSLFLASRRAGAPLHDHVTLTAQFAAGALMVFSFSQWLWLSMLALVVMGFGVIATAAATNTLIQSYVEERFRGRVMSLFTMSFLGMAPIGSFIAGSVGHWVGVPATLLTGGLITLVLAGKLAKPIGAGPSPSRNG